MNMNYVLKVMRLNQDNALGGDLWWRTDKGYDPVTFLILCNDAFYWGGSDCEIITPENLPILEKAYKDTNIDVPLSGYEKDKKGTEWAGLIFCCRVRGMRPQGAMYRYVPKEFWKYLDECGPERKAQPGNPDNRPED